MKYKIGDKVEIKTEPGDHSFEKGEVVEIIMVDGNDPTHPYKAINSDGDEWWIGVYDIKDKYNIGDALCTLFNKPKDMKETIEVKGKKYEECSRNEFYDTDNNSIKLYAGVITYYKEVKEEFKNVLFITDGVTHLEVTEESKGILNVGCSSFNVLEIKRLLKDYKEYLNK